MSRLYKSKDITGNRYGRLTAVRYSHTGKNYMQYWIFKCDCGKEITTRKTAVISGHCKSCGCLQKDVAKQEVVRHSKTHNDSKTRLYKIWKGMHSRCNNENSKYYGSRGITVCSEWNDYKNFKEWAINNGYEDNLTIDRVNYNGNYEPFIDKLEYAWFNYSGTCKMINLGAFDIAPVDDWTKSLIKVGEK